MTDTLLVPNVHSVPRGQCGVDSDGPARPVDISMRDEDRARSHRTACGRYLQGELHRFAPGTTDKSMECFKLIIRRDQLGVTVQK